MKFLQHIKKLTSAHKAKCRGALVLLTALVFMPLTGAALQTGPVVAESNGNIKAPLRAQIPAPAAKDPCLPLLKTPHGSFSSADRIQRPAEKAAALGLVFGLRFALAPVKQSGAAYQKPKARFNVWLNESGNTGDRHALAVARYRECRKNQALQALNSFRWER